MPAAPTFKLETFNAELARARSLPENAAMRRLLIWIVLLPALSNRLSAQTEPRPVVAPPALSRSSHAVAARSPTATSGRYDWFQFNFDQRHSGNDTAETIVSRGNVARLARLFAVALPEIADGAPTVLVDASTLRGVKDQLFVTTKAGRLVALDARSGEILWTRQPATGPNYTTSSTAIDPNRQYVYSYGLEGAVHKYSVFDGAAATGGGWPQLATLKPDVEKGSSALTVARVADGRTFLYVANGGYPGDRGDYQGHVTAINLADGTQRVFNAACSDQAIHFIVDGGADCAHRQTAIWARPGVVYDSATDRIYMTTGNGDFDGHVGGHDWGDTVFSLSVDGTGANGDPLDTYTPTNFQTLDDQDLDLGSAAPAILPAPAGSRFGALALQAGKDAKLRLLVLNDLSQQGGPGHVGGELQILNVPQGGEVLTQPAVWVNPTDGGIWIFVVNDSGVSGLRLTIDASGTPALVSAWVLPLAGFSPIVVNDILFFAGNNRILALNPTDGALLWSDTGIGGIHWESPVVASGILYITDESGMLTAYALDGRLP